MGLGVLALKEKNKLFPHRELTEYALGEHSHIGVDYLLNKHIGIGIDAGLIYGYFYDIDKNFNCFDEDIFIYNNLKNQTIWLIRPFITAGISLYL